MAANQIVRVRHGVYALPWDKTITPSDMDRDVRILRWLLDHGQDLTAEEAGLHLGEAPEVATDRLERIHGAYRYFHIDGARRVRWSKLRPRNPHTAFMVKYYNRGRVRRRNNGGRVRSAGRCFSGATCPAKVVS